MIKVNKGFLAIVAISLLIVIGCFTIPGHSLTGWSGLYETAAHMWVGALIVFAYYMPKNEGWQQTSTDMRWAIVTVLVFITVVGHIAR
jgi:hypothetical protein